MKENNKVAATTGGANRIDYQYGDGKLLAVERLENISVDVDEFKIEDQAVTH